MSTDIVAQKQTETIHKWMNMAVFHNTVFTKTGGRSDLAHILVFDLVFDLDQGLDQDSKVNAKQNSNNYLGYLLKTG